MNNPTIYDIAIVGAGIAGSLAAHRLTQKNPHLKIILIDIGRPPGKRRRQIEGFMGCLPNGDGKFYQNNIDRVFEMCDGRKVNAIYLYLHDWLESIASVAWIKDRLPSAGLQKKMKAGGWEFAENNYFQWSPKMLHEWSKQVGESIEDQENITHQFDTIIHSIVKIEQDFKLIHDKGEIWAHKLLLAPGRTGWRWAKEVFSDLQIPMEDDFAEYGLRLEISSQYVKELNYSNCTITNYQQKLTLGPLSWQGTVIPEDHADLVLSAFRSNEVRWKSEKVSMSLTKQISFPGQGVEENERLAKLSFLLLNDRVSREKLKLFMKKSIVINQLHEFDWIYQVIEELNNYFPHLISRGYFYVPNIITRAPRVVLTKNLETPLPGVFLAGETTNQFGIFAAALTGMIAADGICI